MNNSEVISIVTGAFSIISFLFIYFEAVVKQRERLTKVETKMEIFWKDVSFDSAKILHTPHAENLRRDELLEKFLKETITRNELAELIITLEDIVEDNNRDFGERSAASTLLRALQGRYEIKSRT